VSERGQTRRRLRERRRVREALLLDLGALVYELHRQGRRAPELLQQKAAERTVVDDEVRELEAALDGRAGDAQADEPESATEESDAAELEAELADEEPDEAGEELDELGEDPHELGEEPEDEPAPHQPEDEPALAEHEEPHA
jgi:hypothetical protein